MLFANENVWIAPTHRARLNLKQNISWVLSRTPFPGQGSSPQLLYWLLMAHSCPLLWTIALGQKGTPDKHRPRLFMTCCHKYLSGTTTRLSMLQSSVGDQAEAETSSLLSSYPCPASLPHLSPETTSSAITYTWIPVLAFPCEESDPRHLAKLERKTRERVHVLYDTHISGKTKPKPGHPQCQNSVYLWSCDQGRHTMGFW